MCQRQCVYFFKIFRLSYLFCAIILSTLQIILTKYLEKNLSFDPGHHEKKTRRQKIFFLFSLQV